MILILSSYADPHVERVVEYLRSMGAPHYWYDPADFPRRSRVSLRHGPGGREAWLSGEGGRLNLADVRVAWTRRPGRPDAGLSSPDERVRAYADEECADLLAEVWDSLDATWFPAPRRRVLRLQRKHVQLGVAEDVGFLLPETLVTNDPEAFLAFYQTHGHGEGQAIISKLNGPAMVRKLGMEYLRYTEVVGPRDVAAYRSICHAPTTFQQAVPKRCEVRATVIGSEVYAVQIDSQKTRHTRGDWRRYDSQRTPHCVHRLPDQVRACCLALCERLGLRFGAIDLIVRPDGEYVFLEINPNGQYLWAEDLSGAPLSHAVAKELVRLHEDDVERSPQ